MTNKQQTLRKAVKKILVECDKYEYTDAVDDLLKLFQKTMEMNDELDMKKMSIANEISKINNKYGEMFIQMAKELKPLVEAYKKLDQSIISGEKI